MVFKTNGAKFLTVKTFTMEERVPLGILIASVRYHYHLKG